MRHNYSPMNQPRSLFVIGVAAALLAGCPGVRANAAERIARASSIQGDSFGELQTSAEMPGTSVTIPIRIVSGYIFLDAMVNGNKAVFVLDSGSGADILNADSLKRLRIATNRGKSKEKATGAGGTTAAFPTVIDKLEVGGIVIEHDPAVAIPLPSILGCDGLLGYGFLSQWVTTIDYEKKTLTITQPEVFSAHGVEGLPLTMIGDVPTVRASVDGVEGSFQVDTGNGGAIVLTAPFVEKHGLRNNYPARMETVTGVGVGGAMKGDLARGKTLTIGGTTIPSPIIDLSRQTQGTFADTRFDGNLGSQVLSRFVVSLDYPGQKIYLTPIASLANRFDYNRSGIGVKMQRGTVTVVNVTKKSPAELSGIRVGDQLLEVEGQPVREETLLAIPEYFRQAPGTPVRLTIRRKGDADSTNVVIVLRDLI